MKKMELLAPAGSLDALKGAINAGADAVYMGGNQFGARAYAENPDKEGFLYGLDYAHLRGKKVYLTLNTLLKERELESLYSFLKPMYENGLDGVIFQDLGVMDYIHNQFPDLPLHASTQLSITDATALDFLQKKGCSRAVLARELSVPEIAAIHQESPLELEVFIHGAICYCYSGQCLFSSMLGGRSGNRGRCAQPCRLPYQYSNTPNPINKRKKTAPAHQEYLLSPKDLCGIDVLPELFDAGVSSLKIEGRMKSPEYAAGIVSIYRRALDSLYEGNFHVTKDDKHMLSLLYSRGGNSDGYFHRHNGKTMMTFDSPSYKTGEQSVFDEIAKKYVSVDNRIPIKGECDIEIGKPSKLTVSLGETSVSAIGPVSESAIKRPATEEEIEKRLKKTGDTPFIFEDLSVKVVGDVFMPIQTINELRRDAIRSLNDALLKPNRRVAPEENPEFYKDNYKDNSAFNSTSNSPALEAITSKSMIATSAAKLEYNILVTNLEQCERLLKTDATFAVTIDCECAFYDNKRYQRLVNSLVNAGKAVHLAMPYIFRRKTKELFDARLDSIILPGISGFLIRNIESFEYLKNKNVLDSRSVRADSTLYAYNLLAAKSIYSEGFSSLTLPLELNKKELQNHLEEIPHEFIVYSRLPLMITAGCVKAHKESCTKKADVIYIRDRYNKTFPIKSHCAFCYNTLHNSEPMILWDKKDSVTHDSLSAFRLDFHTETPDEMERILYECLNNLSPKDNFTRGHFNRGVE